METNLLPCPFCGEEARGIAEGVVFCDCGASAPIGAWNTRAGHLEFDGIELLERTCKFKPFSGEDWDEPNSVRGVCSECSALMHGKDSYCPNCGAKVVER